MRREDDMPRTPPSTPVGGAAPFDQVTFTALLRTRLQQEQAAQFLTSITETKRRALDMRRQINQKVSGSDSGKNSTDLANEQFLDAVIGQAEKFEGEIVRVRSGESTARPGAVIQAFENWTKDAGLEAWGYYKSAKNKQDAEAKTQQQEAETRQLVATEIRELVKSFELSEADQAKDKDRTFSVLADMTTGQTWTGVSGVHDGLQPVMRALLLPCKKMELWPLTACAEVEAMNKYLIIHAELMKVDDIPGKNLFFQAGATDRKGAKRACRNCQQWISNMGASRV
jgi:hypothetical protein